MELRQLRYFVCTCHCGSFSKAAEECYISVQGLGMAIARMEDELSQKLFIRSARGITLTEAGQYLLPRAEKILQEVDECEQHFAQMPEVKQQIRVAFSRGTIEEFAGPVISDFAGRHPQLHVDVIEGTDTFCDDVVEKKEAEFGLTVGPVNREKFDCTLLVTLNHGFLCQKNHPLAEHRVVLPQDLKTVPLAMTNPQTRSYQELKDACAPYGFVPTIRTFVDNPLLIFYLVSTSDVCGVAAYNLARRQAPEHVQVIPFAPGTMDWTIYLIRKKGAVLSTRAAELADALIKAAGENSPMG